MSDEFPTVNQIAVLGETRLAEILFRFVNSHPEIAKRLNLELAGLEGVDHLIAETRARMDAINASDEYIDWHRRQEFKSELDCLVDIIVERIAPEKPDEAFALLWQFIELAPNVVNRVEDKYNELNDTFDYAMDTFSRISPFTNLDQEVLAR